MKINEFIKRFGWLRAKQILKYSKDNHKSFLADGMSVTYYDIDRDDLYSIKELRMFLDSRIVVDVYGGLNEAKNYLNSKCLKNDKNSEYLRLAVLDVESCQ